MKYRNFFFGTLAVFFLLMNSCQETDVENGTTAYQALLETYEIENNRQSIAVALLLDDDKLGTKSRNITINVRQENAKEFYLLVDGEEFKATKDDESLPVFGVTGKNVSYGSGVAFGDSTLIVHIEKTVGNQLQFINFDAKKIK